jgi:hypothetical protein
MASENRAIEALRSMRLNPHHSIPSTIVPMIERSLLMAASIVTVAMQARMLRMAVVKIMAAFLSKGPMDERREQIHRPQSAPSVSETMIQGSPATRRLRVTGLPCRD